MARTAVKFGLFVALCMTFLLYLATTIGNTTLGGLVGRGEPTYKLQAAFDDVNGLLLGDNVKVAGVPIGKVTGIKTEAGKAMVSMEISEDWKFPTDTSASIRWRNLIGQRFIYFEPGDSPVTLADDATIAKTTNVVDLGELFNRLGPIVESIDNNQVNDFLDTVNTALDGNQDEISQALDDLAFVVKGLGERDEAIGRLIDNLEIVSRTVADRDAQIEVMLDNLATLSQTFSDNTALLETAILEIGQYNTDLSSVLAENRGQIDNLLGNLDATLNTVEDQIEPLSVLLDQLDENAAATFRTSSYGTFLNQNILCFTVTAPPCLTPVITGLPGVGPNAASTEAVPFSGQWPSGADAIVSLVGGTR